MSVIQNFKKRQSKNQAEQKKHAEKAIKKNTGDQQSGEEKSEALTLLAKLLNVAEENAISEAKKYIESNITFFANDENAEAKKGGGGVKTGKTADETTAENESAINKAASNVEDAASDLAYSASDIANATEELKEATTELKKPSRVRKSSTSEKTTTRKKSSKK